MKKGFVKVFLLTPFSPSPFLFFPQKQLQHDDCLTSKEKQSLIDTWSPTDLVPPLSVSERRAVSNEQTITSYTGRHFSTPTQSLLLNFSTFDFLCLSTSAPVRAASTAALLKYGCGSCGPRGFYGTVDSHLDLEHHVAVLCGVDSTIMYSDGASTVSSTVAAFAKRGDLLVVDEGVYESFVTGITLSRSNVKTFKHNDMADLALVLKAVREEDRKTKRKVVDQRRFIVVEGLYRNYGHICPLDELVRLKDEFKYRLIVDDSFSFGVLGKKGLGIADHFGLVGTEVIDITTVSMENAVGSIGGITVGSLEVVDHQRLSGAGYCFSASAPPFVAAAAVASLKHIAANPSLLTRLAANAAALSRGLAAVKGLEVVSDPSSPLLFCRLSSAAAAALPGGEEGQCAALRAVESRCRLGGVALVATGDHVKGVLLLATPPPMIRLTVNVAHEQGDIDKAVEVVKEAVRAVLNM